MKISPISKISFMPHKNLINASKMAKIPFDSVSFSSNKLTLERLAELKAQASEIKTSASEAFNDSKELSTLAYEQLLNAKSAYLEALPYISLAKKCILSGGCELDNGNTLVVNLSFEDDVALLRITEFDLDELPIKEIVVQDSKPLTIAIYGEEETNVYNFSNRTVEINHDIDENSDDKLIAKYSFVFDGGKLLGIKAKAQFEDDPLESDEYYYFLDNQLISYSKEHKSAGIFGEEAKHKYNFAGGKLVSYFEDFAELGKGATSWDKGYYFKNGGFIAFSENNQQDSWDSLVFCDEAIILDDKNEFSSQENTTFKFDDFGNVCFN